MLAFPNYAKNYASTIDNGLLSDLVEYVVNQPLFHPEFEPRPYPAWG